jgi:hypothetical protein
MPGGGSAKFLMQSSASSGALYETYRTNLLAAVQAKLPVNLRNHKVTITLTDFLAAVSGQSQLNAVIAENTIACEKISIEQNSIDKHNKAPKITHDEMKDFTSKLFDSQLGPARRP